MLNEKEIRNFWKKVNKKSNKECWEWIASLRSGYGRMRLRRLGGDFGAHRLSYIINKGEIPNGLNVMHSCDNPRCVNPNHLSIGTRSDNMKDMTRKGRGKSPFMDKDQSGQRNRNAKLTEKDVIKIISLLQLLNNCQISKIYNVTHSMISSIRLNKSWKHIER